MTGGCRGARTEPPPRARLLAAEAWAGRNQDPPLPGWGAAAGAQPAWSGPPVPPPPRGGRTHWPNKLPISAPAVACHAASGGGGRAGLAGPLLSRAAFLALRAGRRHAQPGAHLRACGRGGRVLPGPTPATADPVPPPWALRCHDTALARVPLQWREPWLEVGRPSLAHPTKAWAAAGPVSSAVGLWSRCQRGCARRQTLV